MSIRESLAGLMGKSKQTAVGFELERDEIEETRAAALCPVGQIEGDLILTSGRLVFVPRHARDSSRRLAWSFDKVDGAGEAPRRGGSFGRSTGYDINHLGEISSVDAGSSTSSFSPPTLVISSELSRFEIGIIAARSSPNYNRSNTTERDRMLAALGERLM